MGSEMCIRDSADTVREAHSVPEGYMVGEADTVRKAHSVSEGHMVGAAKNVRVAHSVPERVYEGGNRRCARSAQFGENAHVR